MNIKLKLKEAKNFQKDQNFENSLKIYSEILDNFSNHLESKKQGPTQQSLDRIAFALRLVIDSQKNMKFDSTFLHWVRRGF